MMASDSIGMAVSPLGASLAWILPAGIVLVASGLAAWLMLKLYRKRTGRWLRELYNIIGQPDPGVLRSSREADKAWRGFVDYVQGYRKLQVEARSRDALGSLVGNENDRLRAVFQALPIGILVLRSSNRVMYVNEVAGSLLQLTDEDEPILESSGGAPHVLGTVRSILSGDLARGIRTERLEVTEPDQETQIYRIRLLASTLTEGLLDQENIQIVTFENITTEEATQRMRTEFVYGVSHELKTPLTSIRASLEMLVEEEDLSAEDRKRLLDLSYSEALRLGRMVRELLDLARIEAGVTEVKRERVVIADLMEELRSVHAPLAQRKSIDMHWEVSDFVPTVIGDRDLLLQAFVNLIGNAIKYTRESGRVGVTVGIEGEELVISIQDNGIGIAAEDLDKIFDKFFRASSAKKTSIPGTGLGLPMARFIVEIHGGRMEVASVDGQGSTFTVYLPGEEAGAEELDTTGLQSMETLSRG
jgi:signal transduction histidine kinase